ARGIDRVVLHRARRSSSHVVAQAALPVVATRADIRGRRDRFPRTARGALLAAAAVLRLAVLPLPEAEPRHCRAGSSIFARHWAADRGALRADGGGPRRDRGLAG